MISIKDSGRSNQIKYVTALFDENCKLQAIETLRYRNINKVSIDKNVSTVTLEFATDQPPISITAQSSGGRTVKGHSERVALAKAINKAIKDGIEPFINRATFKDEKLPEPTEFDLFKDILKSLVKITIYTERMPCTRDGADGSEQCDKFFAKLFEGVNYTFYYSIPLGRMNGSQINQELQQQVTLANKTYHDYLSTREKILDITKQLEQVADVDTTSLIQEKTKLEDKLKKIEDLYKPLSKTTDSIEKNTTTAAIVKTNTETESSHPTMSGLLSAFETPEASGLFKEHNAENTSTTHQITRTEETTSLQAAHTNIQPFPEGDVLAKQKDIDNTSKDESPLTKYIKITHPKPSPKSS